VVVLNVVAGAMEGETRLILFGNVSIRRPLLGIGSDRVIENV